MQAETLERRGRFVEVDVCQAHAIRRHQSKEYEPQDHDRRQHHRQDGRAPDAQALDPTIPITRATTLTEQTRVAVSVYELAAIGAVGLAIATLVSGIGSLLYGIGARDFIAFAGGTGVVMGVALTASFFPSWKASRTDPLTALRHRWRCSDPDTLHPTREQTINGPGNFGPFSRVQRAG